MSQRLSSQWGRRWLALSWLTLLGVAALLGPVLPLPVAPDTTDLAAISQPPFAGLHWLGTDPLGRDILAGLVFGARMALLVSLPSAALATLLGSLAGSIAGFWGNEGIRVPKPYACAALGGIGFCLVFQAPPGILLPATAGVVTCLFLGTTFLYRHSRRSWVSIPFDQGMLSAIALLASVPLLVLTLILASLYRPSLPGLVAVLVGTYWPGPARLVRAEVLRIRALPYIDSGWALGLPASRILWRHAWPNCWHTIRTTFPISVASLIGLETTLSFLGVGLPPEAASWGRILAAARLAPTDWWLIVFPTLAILLTTLSLRVLSGPRN